MGILEEIVLRKKKNLKDIKAQTPLRVHKEKIRSLERTRNFLAAIKRPKGENIRLIAEIKKASPSKGIIRKNFNHLAIAEIYEKKQADAVSVLTEEIFFKGHLSFLHEVKKVLTKPVLRKDFIFDEYQIYESRTCGADAILLIAGILEKNQAQEYLHHARELGLSVLFEVHDNRELEMALLINTDIIGINNRNLKTLEINVDVTFSLIKDIPGDKIIVTESGIDTRTVVQRLEDAGIDAMLVGSSLMQAENIGKKIDELTGRA